jgi:hypothetical protein
MLSYTVDGLSFYYIPHSVPIKPGAEAKLATISVIEGEMNSVQVKAKMETLREKYTVETCPHKEQRCTDRVSLSSHLALQSHLRCVSRHISY